MGPHGSPLDDHPAGRLRRWGPAAPLTSFAALALLRLVIERATPSLRISRLIISNFRTFRGPTEIVLSNSQGVADEMPVFHGGNGTGKSNALAALELFFRVSAWWTTHRRDSKSDDLELLWNVPSPVFGFTISSRDWPPGTREPATIEVQFQDTTSLKLTLTQAGSRVFVRLTGDVWTGLAKIFHDDVLDNTALDLLSKMKSRLETPRGVGSKSIFRLNARRHDFKFIREGEPEKDIPPGPLTPALANRLHELATSLEPQDTERWRAFIALIGRFKTLQVHELSVVKIHDDDVVDLRFEIRGKQILRISELSSGEQQVVALCAAVLTSGAAIVAIEEPEISLHPDNQELVRDVLQEQVRNGLVDQIILESHVPIFDGPEVLRFSRSADGVTSVERQTARLDDVVAKRARESGAEEQWVTPEGYTKLPEIMRKSLDLEAGGYLWFLQSTPEGRWEAWKSAELDEMFGFRGAPDKE